MDMVGFLSQLNMETEVLLTLSIILFSGFIMTRMTNTLNMPKVSGYILAGILIGPCCLDFIPGPMIEGMGFISDLALAFIAFGVGKFFKKEVLMRTGKRIIVITISEALAAGVLVTLALKWVFGLDWEFALILGAIATATAPASTMMTINQYKAKGEFVDTLLQIVALDDVVCLLSFSIVSAIINGNAAGGLSVEDILIPVACNLLVIVLGVFCGYFLSRLLIPSRSRDNRLILAIAMLLGLSGICAAMDISPLLSCMVFGAVYINLTRDKKLFRQINSFTPPVMSVFFIVSGMKLDLEALTAVGAIGVGYFLVRIIGKYMGTYLSCLAMKTSREIRNYMGLALIPQAGVAIGLAFLGQRMLPHETGSMMLTIILSSSVLYEMVGPVSAKAALLLSGSIPFGKKAGSEGSGDVEGSSGAVEGEEGLAGNPATMGEESPEGDTVTEGPETEVRASVLEQGRRGAGTDGAEPGEGTPVEPLEGQRAEGLEKEEAPEAREGTGAKEAPEAWGSTEPREAREEAGPEKEEMSEAREGIGTKEAPEAWESTEPKEAREETGLEKEEMPEAREGTGPEKKEKQRKERKSQGKSKDRKRKSQGKKEPQPPGKTDTEVGEACEEQEEDFHAVLPELREYSRGVEDSDVYDIERELKPPKGKKKKKGKKQERA